MAANVLLRADAPVQPDQQTAGIEDQYLVIKLLLPQFEQYAPMSTTNSIRTRFETLGAMVRDSVRRRDPNPTEDSPSETESADREQVILGKIDRGLRTSVTSSILI